MVFVSVRTFSASRTVSKTGVTPESLTNTPTLRFIFSGLGSVLKDSVMLKMGSAGA